MLQGLGVSAGIGYAQAMTWQAPVSQDYVPHRSGNPDVETRRLDAALKSIRARNRALKHKTVRRLGKSEAIIFDAYELILSDEEALVLPTKEKIRQGQFSAEYAVALQFGEMARSLLELNNDYLRQRAEDVYGLRDQLLREMMGVPEAEANHLDRPTIVVASALTPSDIANLDLSRLEGIICEAGSYSSHMAIIARTLGIPAVVGVEGAMAAVPDGGRAALDGESGEVWVAPGPKEVRMLRHRATAVAARREKAQLFRGLPTISTDGRRVELSANVGKPDEMDTAIHADAESIGMFRTELLYREQEPDQLPTEDEQFEVYREVLSQAGGKAVTVRTFDDGGDKQASLVNGREEINPVLGFRGIRMSLGRPSFFRAQLRALLRASAYGSLKVMFPMVAGLDELMEAKRALEAVKDELRREKIPFDEGIPVGVLVSVPSTALMSWEFAPEVNFFSINLGDLIQFTLAIDNSGAELVYLYQQYHPAVLRLIKTTVEAAHAHNIPCYLCGEAPVQSQVLPLMMGLGVDGFSMNPSTILSARQTLNGCNYQDCKQLAAEVLALRSVTDVVNRLERDTQGRQMAWPLP